MAQILDSASNVLDDVVPSLEPLRGGLSLMAGATTGALIDMGIKAVSPASNASGWVMPLAMATAESMVAVVAMDIAAGQLSGFNSMLFMVGAVHNLDMVTQYGDALAMAVIGRL